MQEVFFTADSHFGHAKVLEYDSRPFESIEEHDEKTIALWNATVSKRDIVHHLGDVCLRGDVLHRVMPRLNGHKFLYRGNHDDRAAWRYRKQYFGGYWEARYMKIGEHGLYLSHYAHRVWRGSNRGAFHLHGHSHGQLPDNWGKSMDVGFPCTGYKPIHWDEIFEKLKDREPVFHKPQRDA